MAGRRPKDQTLADWLRSLCPDCGRKRAACECLELHLLRDVRAYGLPEPVREFPFAHPRKWRADFAWPDYRVLVEVEGGGRVGHHQNDRYADDCEKYNAAARLGWCVLRYTGAMIKRGRGGVLAVDEITLALHERGWKEER